MSFQERIYSVLKGEPFYARLSSEIDKVPCSQTLNIRVLLTFKGKFQIRYNPTWINSLSDAHFKGSIIHELEHVRLGHLTHRRPPARHPKSAKYWNIATDLAINTNIPSQNLPRDVCRPGQGPFVNFKYGLPSEVYYQQLLDENFDDSEVSEFDDHSDWDIVEGLSGDESERVRIHAQQYCDQLLKKAVEEASATDWGSVPYSIQQTLKAEYSNRVNWKKVLNTFYQSAVSNDCRKTYTRLHRKYGNLRPGRKDIRAPNILVAIDASGSVSDQLYNTFWGEVSSLVNLSQVIVALFDTGIDPNDVFVWKKGESKPPKRTKRGGTDFNCVMNYAKDHKFDAIVILTDMGAGKPISSSTPRLWVTREQDHKSCRWVNDVRDRFAIVYD